MILPFIICNKLITVTANKNQPSSYRFFGCLYLSLFSGCRYLGHLDLDLFSFSACISSALYLLSACKSTIRISTCLFWVSLKAALSSLSNFSHTRHPPVPSNLYLLLPASKLESILMLAPSSLILLMNAEKLLPTVISKIILGLIHLKSIHFI